MTANVVDLAQARESRAPHEPRLRGIGRCGVCKHEWQAVAPLGTFTLECPSCGAMRGYFNGHVESRGASCFTCNYCNGQVFQIIKGDPGAHCIGCGFVHSWDSIT